MPKYKEIGEDVVSKRHKFTKKDKKRSKKYKKYKKYLSKAKNTNFFKKSNF